MILAWSIAAVLWVGFAGLAAMAVLAEPAGDRELTLEELLSRV